VKPITKIREVVGVVCLCQTQTAWVLYGQAARSISTG
jgi:hypothetical protein